MSLLDTPRWINVNSVSILHRNAKDQVLTNFHVISMYSFNIILLIKKSTLLPRIYIDVISVVEKSYFFGVISLLEKYRLFSGAYFDIILVVEISTVFPRTFLDLISLVEKSTLFLHIFFDIILMIEKSTLLFSTKFWWVKIRRCLWLNCKLMKSLDRRDFPVWVTLKNWLSQDFSP